MKVLRFILIFMLLFSLVFVTVPSLDVKALSIDRPDSDFVLYTCDSYKVRVMYDFDNNGSTRPEGWYNITDHDDNVTYSFRNSVDVNNVYRIYFVVESLQGPFVPSLHYRFDFSNVDLSYSDFLISFLYTANDFDHLWDKTGISNDQAYELYGLSSIGGKTYFNQCSFHIIPPDKVSNFFIFSFVFNSPVSVSSDSAMKFSLRTAVNSDYVEDPTEEPTTQPPEEPSTRDPVQDAIDQGNQQAHEDAQQAHQDAEEQKGLLGKIVDGILGLPKLIIDGLIDGLKKLFIPDSEAVNQIIKDIQDTFSDAFGFLSYPFDLLGKVLDLFLQAGGDAVITVPEWRFMDHVVIPEYTYNLSENPIVKQLLPYIRSLTSCILAWNFLGLCRKKYDEVIKGGDSS